MQAPVRKRETGLPASRALTRMVASSAESDTTTMSSKCGKSRISKADMIAVTLFFPIGPIGPISTSRARDLQLRIRHGRQDRVVDRADDCFVRVFRHRDHFAEVG